MATVKEINHDSSTTLSDFYNTISNPDSAITVTVGAALDSSTNGVNVNYDAGSNNASFQQTFTAISTGEFRIRFRIDTSNLTTLSFGIYFAFSIFNSSTEGFIQIQLKNDPTEIQALYWDDSVGDLVSLGSFSLSSGIHCIEARCVRESVDTAADGEVELLVDGISQASVTNVDNFVAWDANKPDRVTMEVLLTSILVGALFYDEFIVDGDDQADLGCSATFSGYDLVLGGGQP